MTPLFHQNRFRTKRGFTLLEALMSGIIFSMVLVASFSLYRYLIELGVDSRNVSNVKNYQETAFDMVDQMIAMDGWTPFLDAHLNQAEFTLVGTNLNTNATYTIQNINSNNSTILPAPSTVTGEPYSWTFRIESDASLGLYIKSVKAESNGYSIIFSHALATDTGIVSEPLIALLPFINEVNQNWGDSSFALAETAIQNDTIRITYPGTNPVLLPGLLIKPSPKVQDTTNNSDITYTRGVEVPLTVGGESKGYPNVIKATVTISVGDISYRATRYIRYKES